jgi:hypothetical protein
MAYTTTRVWYGPESYQWAVRYLPSTHTIGVSAPLPCIAYRPGGGWRGADVADLESRIWWTYGLNDGASAYNEDYAVFVVNTASIGYNRSKITGLTAWADATAYALGDYRGRSGRLYVCIDAHTSSAANDEPGTGTNWDDYWREVGLNETGLPQVADLGECTPGGLDEMVSNVQQFMAWLKVNAAANGVDDTKIALAGASAGGQMAGCAAYAEEIPWARGGQVYGAARDVPRVSCRPRALLLSITPVDLTYHTQYGLLNGLYGEDSTDGAWVARDAAIKRAMSPLHVLRRTMNPLPTYMDHAGFGPHTAGTAFTGLTGTPYHHPDNGWLLLRYLASARPTGLGRTDCRFVDDSELAFPATVWLTATAYVVGNYVTNGDARWRCISDHTSGASTEPGVGASFATVWAPVNYRSYSNFNDAAGVTIGTTPQSVASHILAWLNGILGV